MQAASEANFVQWYTTVWKRATLFEGRSGRPEFWWFFLGQLAVAVVFFVLAGISGIFFWLEVLWWIASLLPGIAVTARRLHDIGMSGWVQLIALVPILGGLALLVLCAIPSQAGSNRYGDAPLPPLA